MAYSWKNYPLIPRANLLAWHQFEEGVSANNLINDYSGNGRHLTCSSSGAPVLTANLLNGQSGWHFTGTSNPLNVTATLSGKKHIFLVFGFEDPTITTNQGLMSGVTVGDTLITDTSGNKFFDLSIPDYTYRKSDVIFPTSNQQLPVNGNIAVIEVQFAGAGIGLDGIQIGQDKTLTARKIKGYFFEHLMYSDILNDLGRFRLYNYFAMRYRLWQENGAGLYIFPFGANRTVSGEFDIENFVSEPYSGPIKALTRGSFKTGFSSQYLLRQEEEFTAARAFYQQHRPVKDFVFRDWRYNTPNDVTCRFTSPIRDQGSETSYRFNYQFDHVQTA